MIAALHRILVADPDKHLLALYQAQLSAEGLHVETARDGLECLARLREFGPDVLVLEPAILWGGGDGLLAVMHDEPGIARVPVVLVLTYGCSSRVLYNIAPFPISDYLEKPLSGARLAQRIRCSLARYESATPIRPRSAAALPR